MRSSKSATAVCVGLVILALCSSSPAQGATLTVTNLNDSGPSSLRDLIAAANSDDTIDFAVTGIITLTSGELLISKNLTISGPGTTNLTISGNHASRIFTVQTGVTANISGLSIRDGSASEGGGINNIGGKLTVMDCTLWGNTATGGSGGAIVISGNGDLTLTRSTLAGNNAIFGGGISSINGGVIAIGDSTIDGNMVPLIGGGAYHTAGTLTITNSTISNNIAGAGGGGIFVDFFTGRDTVANIVQSTIAGNTGGNFGGGIAAASGVVVKLFSDTISRNSVSSGDGGGLAIAGLPPITARNTIIAGNQTSGGSGPNCAGMFFSEGHNLLDDISGCQISGDTGTNVVGLDALLSQLQDNGGPTFTLFPNPGSPAIGAADPNGPTDETGSPLLNDQRSFLRVNPPTIGSVDPTN